jgi:putative hydroxymethylpyrimidine transport system ATP-binding protein
MLAPPPTVEVRGLTLSFGAREVLSDLDLNLDAGQWTGLLGRSGVGKSSLLRVLAGLIADSDAQGAVRCDDGGEVRGRVAYMAQQDLLLPWLSVVDNVTLGHRLRGGRAAATAARPRALELLERVDLARRGDDLPAALSGGMRQRAALARTLMEDRPIVLMDEPFSALDSITRQRLQDLAAELLSGRTVLLVTHDPLEALRLCHKVHVLQGPGRPLAAPIVIPGHAPPRPSDDPAVLAKQGDLLCQLAAWEAAA